MPTKLETTRVDLSGLLEVLGKSLYSTPAVALRELVQNAHDSIVRRRLESDVPFDAWIAVTCRTSPHKIVIEDGGAGLTADEIERYLATIGSGYTRRLRTEHDDGSLIGMFGLGFLTAFIVSRRVDVYTTSYQDPDRTWHFSSQDGQRYAVEPADLRPIGTRVELTLGADFEHLAEPAIVEMLASRYCALLPTPVYLDEARERRANDAVASWRLPEPPSGLRKKKLDLELARRFERTFAPICTYDVDAEGLRGCLWIQDGSTYATSDNRNVSVFVRGMLVSDDARDLVPAWAGFVGGVLESDRLAPTASREELREDEAFDAARHAVHEALIDGLAHSARHDPANWRRIVLRHNEALLGAALSDRRLFDIIADDLKVPTSSGDLTVDAIAKKSDRRVHVSLGEKGSPEETLFRALMVPVVTGTRFAAYPFAKRVAETKGYRFVELGTEGGNAALFRPAELASSEEDALLAAFELEEASEMEVVLARFEPSHLPVVAMPDREAQLKTRIESDEADRRIGSAVLGLARMFTAQVGERPPMRLYVNASAPAVRAMLGVAPARRRAAARLMVSWATVMASHGEDAPADVVRMLHAFSASIVELLNGGD